MRFCVTLLLAVSLLPAQKAEAQAGSLIKSTVKDIVLDPTTYTPFFLSVGAKKLDWDSSQIFFKNGFVEGNTDFTISGKPNDLPIDFAAGNRKIVLVSLPVLQMSLVNNLGVSLSENILIKHHPEHKGLIKILGWIEKSAFAYYLMNKTSVPNFHQWQKNKRLTKELGLQ